MKKFTTTILALASAFTAFADSITKTTDLSAENVADVYIPYYCEPGDEWDGYLYFGCDAYGGMWRYVTENDLDLSLAKHGFSTIDSVSIKLKDSFFKYSNTGAPNTYYNREKYQYLKAFEISIWKGIDGDALDDSNNPDNYPLAMISGLSDVDLRNGITLKDIGLDDCDYILIKIEIDNKIIPDTGHSTDETIGFFMGGHKIELTLTGQEMAPVPEPAEWAAIFGAIALGAAVYRRRK